MKKLSCISHRHPGRGGRGMKKIIGCILLVSVFTFLIGTTCVVFGFKTGMGLWGIGFGIALIICLAIFLIEEGE